MKTVSLLISSLAPAVLSAQENLSQDAAKVPTNGTAPALEASYEIKSSHTKALDDGTGRKVIMQRVKPLVLHLRRR